MNKNIPAIGIIILFILSALAPITFGSNVRTTNDKESQSATLQQSTQINNHIWPMHKYDAQCTGRSPYDTSQNKGGEKWKYFIDQSLHKTPTIDQNGTLYIGTGLDELHAIYPDGTRKWKKDLSGIYCRVPTIASDGTIHFGNFDRFHAFYPNGTLKWKFNEGDNFLSEPVIDSNGTVYAGTQDGVVYAIYSNGTMKWEYEVLDYIFYIALDKNENIYFGGPYTNSLFCLYPNGTLKWRYKKFSFYHGPVIAEDGMIYAVPIHWLVALYPNGTVKWIVDYSENDCYGFPSIAPDGKIILSGDDDYISALNPDDGSIIWQYQIGDEPHIGYVSTAAIGGDGSIYFAYDAYSDSNAFLVALNPDGSLKWETSLTTDIHPYDFVHILSDPSIGSDGTIYITSWFGRGGSNYTDIGYIHAIGMDNPVAPEPPTISGPSYVKLFKVSEYILNCSFSAGEDVYYLIDWDEESDNVDDNCMWIGPYSSDEEVVVKHWWYILGEHTIKVRGRGNDSLCSPWSYFDVKVGLSRNRESYNSNLFLRFLEQFPLLERLFYHIK